MTYASDTRRPRSDLSPAERALVIIGVLGVIAALVVAVLGLSGI